MFQGASLLALDAKGRLSLPTRHREAPGVSTGGQLTLTRHPHGCLMVFTLPEWEQFGARVASLPMQAQCWRGVFPGQAMGTAMDAAPVVPEFSAAADIDKEAVLRGMGSYFEWCGAPAYGAREAAQMKGQMPDIFRDFSF